MRDTEELREELPEKLQEETLELPGTGDAPEPVAVRLARPSEEPRGWILYLHGFRSCQEGEKAAFFRRRAVAEGLAFCSFDFRGHGHSGGSLGKITPSRNLQDIGRVHEWLRERGGRRAERPVILGSSMGGAAALWFAARNPQRVRAALAIAPALDMKARLEAWAGEEGLAEWQRTGSRHWADELGEAELGWGLVEDLGGYPISELVEHLETPALLLQGRQDASVGWQGAVELASRARPGLVDLHLFGDGDHRLLAHRERLWSLMRAFLAARRLV